MRQQRDRWECNLEKFTLRQINILLNIITQIIIQINTADAKRRFACSSPLVLRKFMKAYLIIMSRQSEWPEYKVSSTAVTRESP